MVSIDKRNNENKNILNQLEPIKLGQIDSLNNEGDVIPIEFKIKISHEDIDDIIKKEKINLSVTESEISDAVISHHFDNGPYGSSTSSSSVDIRDTKEITEFNPVSGEYKIDVEFIEDGSYAGDESADYELGVQLLDENENIVDSISEKFTVTNTTTVTGSSTGTFNIKNNEYAWRFYLASNGATVTRWSPNNPDNEGFIDLYQI